MLTYDEHKIKASIAAAQLAGRLIAAPATVPWAGTPRMFLMCDPLVKEIEEGKSDADEKIRNRWAKLVADIGHFVEGGYINDDLMKQLLPEKFEHWELRSRKPKPSIRVFRRFALPNVFIGTHSQPRTLLGGMWSSQFEHEKLVCEQHLKEAGIPETSCFTDNPHFRYEKYITENASRKIRILK